MIKTVNLTKIFNENKALDNLNFQVGAGSLFGLVGPDGAGKTTTMRILAGVMHPSSGDAFISGISVGKTAHLVREKIGYMSQRFGLYEDLTVIENINFYADIYNVSGRERKAKIDELLAFSNLVQFKNRLAGELSGGMKQKLGLSCALVHTPEALLLDEPTCGVDPVSRRDFWKILYELLKKRITILVSTAYLDEAERCNRVGFIYKGRLLIEEDPGNIKKTFFLPMFEINTGDILGAKKIIEKIEGVKELNIYGEKIHTAVTDKKIAAVIKDSLAKEKIEVRNIREITPMLEDIFISMVRKEEEGY